VQNIHPISIGKDVIGMADTSRRADITAHPDVPEMRERYERIVSGPRAVTADGMIMLSGAYLAISPWVVHFNGVSTNLAVTNLVLGLCLVVLGFGLTLAPERMHRLSWTCIPLGVFTIIAPWVATVGHTATRPMMWSNIIAGGAVCLFGLMEAGMVMSASRGGGGRSAPRTAARTTARRDA
jgi:hypothetical protein